MELTYENENEDEDEDWENNLHRQVLGESRGLHAEVVGNYVAPVK